MVDTGQEIYSQGRGKNIGNLTSNQRKFKSLRGVSQK